MKQRWILGAGALVVIGGAAMLIMKTDEPAGTSAKATRSGKVEIDPAKPAAPEQVASNAPPRMVMTESGLRPQASREPRVWKDPKNGAINREIVDAVANPTEVARQELEYRKSRLRLDLIDAAESCWNNGPSKESIEVDYTLSVTDGVLRADNVRIKNSTITDPKVQDCIVGSFRDLTSFADGVPDMKQEGGVVVSLNDLDQGNKKKDRQGSPAATDVKQPFDKD